MKSSALHGREKERRRSRPPLPSKSGRGPSLLGGEMRAPIALVAVLRLLRATGPLPPIAYGSETVPGYPELHQELLDGGRPAVAETEVVLGRAALIGVALDHETLGGEPAENRL